MKSLLALALTLVASSAFANMGDGNERSNGPTSVHVYSRGMSCAAVQNAVAANGAVILHYGPSMYDRVVADNSYCSAAADQEATAYWAPTRDQAQCFAGYTCEDNDND